MIFYAILCSSMLFYAIRCCATLCYAVLRCATLCYAVLRYATLCYAVLRCATLCYAVLCCATLCYAVLRCATLCHAVPCCATLCHAVPRCATLCHAVPRCATLHTYLCASSGLALSRGLGCHAALSVLGKQRSALKTQAVVPEGGVRAITQTSLDLVNKQWFLRGSGGVSFLLHFLLVLLNEFWGCLKSHAAIPLLKVPLRGRAGVVSSPGDPVDISLLFV